MRNLLLFVFFVQMQANFAQDLPCGVIDDEPYEAEAARQQVIEMLKASPGFSLPTTSYIAIKVHAIGTTSGTGHLSAQSINNALSKLNKEFKPANIEFYFAGSSFAYHNDSYFYAGVQTDAENQDFHDTHGVSNAINLYLQDVVLNGGNAVGGYSYVGPTSQPYNRMYIKNIQLDNARTFTHEVAHYFTLRHTFNNSAHAIVSNRELVTRNPNELAPRLSANCATMGDYLCDTHADPYGVGNGGQLSGCNYAGTVIDANLDPFTPHVKNFMGYHTSCTPFSFTPGQFNRIMNGHVLVTNPANGFTLNAPETAQVAPSNIAVTSTWNTITVSWTDNSSVETGYIIESANSPEGPFTSIGGVGPNTTVYTFSSTGGIQQYFRVKPSNSKNNYSSVSLSVADVRGAEKIAIVPNPVQGSLNLVNDGNLVIDFVEVTNMSGQVILREAASTGTIDASGLSSGIYMIKATAGDRSFYGKFVRQ